ncbi:hypothetical protein BkAM31D_13315 [Halalkalibacter krulwichiae]|uniref:Uncharacterized protein n=1 Tax=Halalkalibacter krulwichiae TaxID=199441 RepID=A0A1X9MDV5_9BACI|nr:hypothetical protein BkAM31D_13315 [Halalkalibacter krulwichiae]
MTPADDQKARVSPTVRALARASSQPPAERGVYLERMLRYYGRIGRQSKLFCPGLFFIHLTPL